MSYDKMHMTIQHLNGFCVVTPNFNMAKYLPETIESVLANLREGDHYFVIDGGSTDGSLDIIKSYADKITGWVSEPDRSYADAVGKGLSRSANEYQCWVPCGDLLLRGALDMAREVFNTRHTDMIFGDDLFIDESSRILQVTNGCAPELAPMMWYSLWSPLQDACFWRRSLYESIGGINPDIKYAADYDLFLRMAMAGKTYYSPSVFSAFRSHTNQTSKLHQVSYKREKILVRNRMQESGLKPLASALHQRLFYWLYPRLRARFKNSKTVAAKVLGQYALTYDAAPTKLFGVSR